MSEGGGDQQQELPGGGVDSDDAVVVDPSMVHSPAPRRGCAFAAFVEAALEDVSNAAGSCRGAHYKNVKAACQAALGEDWFFLLIDAFQSIDGRKKLQCLQRNEVLGNSSALLLLPPFSLASTALGQARPVSALAL